MSVNRISMHGSMIAISHPMKANDQIGSGWSDMQVRYFAKRFAFANKSAWHAYVDGVREALIDSFILLIVLEQDRSGVQVDEIRSTRSSRFGLVWAFAWKCTIGCQT